MKSWIMKLWLRTHSTEEWPDLSVSQGTDAAYVLGEDSHPSKANIERMCCEEFFAEHRYNYVEASDVYCPKEQSEKSANPLYNPPYENSSQVGEAIVSDYSCPETGIVCPCETRNQTSVLSPNVDFLKWIKENQNVMYANERSSKDEPQYATIRECGDKGGAYHVRARHTAHAASRDSDADHPPVHYERPPNIREPACDQASPLRRKNAFRRKKQQNFEYRRQAKCKPEDKENVCENTKPLHELRREHVYESQAVEMEDEREESPLQAQATARERQNFALQR